MANHELVNLPKGGVPAHISSLFASLGDINADAMSGINAGMYPIIKLNGTRFVLVKDGQETPVKALEIKVVVLKAKAGFEKRYYGKKFDPTATDAVAPDCYSLDGIKPVAGCANQQNTACAGCKQNQFGSGTDQNGNPGKGKACSDRKLLAVLYPNPDTKALEIYGLSLPPASLKNFGDYVRALSSNNIPLPAAFTLVSFDDRTSFPVLEFKFGGVMGEAEAAQVIPMIQSEDVKTIMEFSQVAQSPIPNAVSLQPEPPAQADSGFGFTPEAPKEKATRAPRKAKEEVVEPVKEEAAPADDVSDDELSAMLGL
jgi:hypothetical protein